LTLEVKDLITPLTGLGGEGLISSLRQPSLALPIGDAPPGVIRRRFRLSRYVFDGHIEKYRTFC